MTQHPQKNLPQDKGTSTAVAFQQSQIFSGPLPHPEILARYDSIVRGAAERIIKMAENQSSHRIEIEKNVINSDISNSRRGQWFGLIVSLTCILASVLLILKGYTTAGSILGGGTIASLAAVFVYGARVRSRERVQKETRITENVT